jgi:dinuclear metal center YbgI/SA1388 family protein
VNSLQELVGYLHDYLNCGSFHDKCHNGLQVEGRREVRSVATAVTASLDSIEAAVAAGADALIVHHGLFWEGWPGRITGTLHQKVELLIKHRISLLAYHLPLDAHRELGNNWVAAGALGLVELAPFGDYNGMAIGVRGRLPEPLLQTAWVSRVEAYYGQKGRAALFGPERITSTAIISGGAHRYQEEAIEAGLDGFITGTGDAPNWLLSKEHQRLFLAMGHEATERIGVRALAVHLQTQCGLETRFLPDSNTF